MSARRTVPHRSPALLARLAGLFFLVLAGPAAAQYCQDCISLSTPRDSYRPSEQVPLQLEVDAARVGAARADLYLAAIQPDNRARILRRVPDWEVADKAGERLLVVPSAEGETGEYRLYFVLAEAGADPFDTRRWLSAASVDIVLLPEDWTPPASPPALVNAGGLPRVVTHGGGEINGQLVSNSRQALDQAYAAGQRFFELDFSWTADRHLVLIHDWEQSFRRLFAGSGEVPDKAAFDGLDMHFGLSQMNVDQLLEWLARHPEARVITDIKESNVSGLYYLAARAGELRSQLIPQVHEAEEFATAAALGFDHLIFTLYRGELSDSEVLEAVRRHAPLAVALPVGRALRGDTAAALNAAGVFVYAHSVNHPALFALLRERGVSGIYSDRLYPAR